MSRWNIRTSSRSWLRFIAKSILIITAIVLLLVMMTTMVGCSKSAADQYSRQTVQQVQQPVEAPPLTWEQVKVARELEIREAFISIGKHYDIYVDGKKVGEVTGEFITAFGDTFTLTDAYDNVIMTESQQRRSFRFSLDRLAVVEDAYGNLHGFLGEEVIRDFFSPFTWFHFYDANEQELGKYKAKIDIVSSGAFVDNSGNEDYRFKGALISLTDKYTLTVVDQNSSIPLEYAIFMVCIRDAINDSQEDDDD